MNACVLIGRLTADPELRYTASGVAVATFTLAVDRQKQKDREKETDFINIVVWQKLGELCAQYLKKGRLAAVEGRLQIRQYENKDGQKVKVAEIVANQVQFLDKGDSADKPQQQKPQTVAKRYDDDPFADDGQSVDIVDDDLPF
jgi:single-strand DNA-binding protein